ncbi:MAG: hypothetical protein RMZ95_028595 [Nostoc sp. DedQUE07]|nr:hypothetical protein [Nostoc sp. DedQUE07]MDZ8132456.1 hypothetical protein [Nostoc sp. DedQUE07]
MHRQNLGWGIYGWIAVPEVVQLLACREQMRMICDACRRLFGVALVGCIPIRWKRQSKVCYSRWES